MVKLGSFRGAAQRLNTTQPAISQRIAQLEREMGVKLLNRDHRVASPTPSGRQMMIYAEKLIGLRAEMMAEVGDRTAMRGVLRLGVAETIVHTWLPRLVKSVNDGLPEPVAGDRGRHHAESERAAARPGNRTRLRGRAAVGLRACKTACCAITRSAFWPAPRSASAMAASRGRIWRNFRSSPFRARPSLMKPCASLFNRPDLPPIRLHASASLATVIHMAIEGLGIAVIPTAIVENELADGQLQLLDDRHEDARR